MSITGISSNVQFDAAARLQQQDPAQSATLARGNVSIADAGQGAAPSAYSNDLIAAQFGLQRPANGDGSGSGDIFGQIGEAVSKAVEEITKVAAADAPHGPFASADEAATAAMDYANPLSIRDNVEYGGLVYKDANGDYYAARAHTGDGDSVSLDPSSIPAGTELVGYYHTHAAYSVQGPNGEPVRTDDPAQDDYNSDNFSQQDKRVAQNLSQGASEFTAYVATPGGDYRSYDPGTGVDQIIN